MVANIYVSGHFLRELKPNFITLASSELAPNMFELAGSKLKFGLSSSLLAAN